MIKITFDVWENAKGEVHLTSDDKRLDKGINIRARDALTSTSVLRKAIREQAGEPAANPTPKPKKGRTLQLDVGPARRGKSVDLHVLVFEGDDHKAVAKFKLSADQTLSLLRGGFVEVESEY